MTTITRREVPFVDLRRLHEPLHSTLGQAFERVLDRGSFTLGEEVETFEREFAEFVGVRHAIGVASGTDALHFALRGYGIGPGDEVITAANSFAATAEAIVMCGARPVFVDVDSATCLMDLNALSEALTSATKAIIPVHLYGQMVDMHAVRELAGRHDLLVIEDACQAHGATRDGMVAGASGNAGCFSFYPSKNLGALGDGGMVTTDDPDLAAQVRLLRNHGEDASRLHLVSGYCSRLHGLQAALLRTKLPKMAEWNQSRRRAAALYDELLADSAVLTPTQVPGATHVYHLYVVRVAERDRVRARISEAGVQTGIHYPVPLHLEPAFSHAGHLPGDMPVAERFAGEILSLPMYPYLEDDEIRYVVGALKDATHG